MLLPPPIRHSRIHQGAPEARQELQVADEVAHLQCTRCKLQVASCKPQVTSCKPAEGALLVCVVHLELDTLQPATLSFRPLSHVVDFPLERCKAAKAGQPRLAEPQHGS